MKEYLEHNSEEVKRMLSTQWDEELFIEVMREEGASIREMEIARNMKAEGSEPSFIMLV